VDAEPARRQAPVPESDFTDEMSSGSYETTRRNPPVTRVRPAEELVESQGERAWVLSTVPSPGEERVQVHSQAFWRYKPAAGLVLAGEDTRSPRDKDPWDNRHHTLLTPGTSAMLAIAVMTRQHAGDGAPDVRAAAPQENLPGGPWDCCLPHDVLRDIALRPDTVRRPTRFDLRHRIVPDTAE